MFNCFRDLVNGESPCDVQCVSCEIACWDDASIAQQKEALGNTEHSDVPSVDSATIGSTQDLLIQALEKCLPLLGGEYCPYSVCRRCCDDCQAIDFANEAIAKARGEQIPNDSNTPNNEIGNMPTTGDTSSDQSPQASTASQNNEYPFIEYRSKNPNLGSPQEGEK